VPGLAPGAFMMAAKSGLDRGCYLRETIVSLHFAASFVSEAFGSVGGLMFAALVPVAESAADLPATIVWACSSGCSRVSSRGNSVGMNP
ncbi:MAG: hypothetical protein WED27_05930, partial [Pirellulales bacterium]